MRRSSSIRLFSLLVAAVLVGATLAACGGTSQDNGAPSIVGTWRGSTTMGCLGQVSDEVIFKADGTFSRLTTSSQVNCVPGTLMVRTTGDYEVDASNGVIRLTNIDTEPKEQCLPPTGCQPVHAVTSDTLTYTMPDDNTLTLSCGPGCVITYSRASP